MKKQNDDIDELIKSMKKQFIDMRTDYTEQLDQIEKAFLRERNDIIQNNETEVKSLLKQQEKLEKKYQEDRSREEENYNNQIEKLKT